MHAAPRPLPRRAFEILKTPPPVPAAPSLATPCPKCAHDNPVLDDACAACGLVFAKYFARPPDLPRPVVARPRAPDARLAWAALGVLLASALLYAAALIFVRA